MTIATTRPGLPDPERPAPLPTHDARTLTQGGRCAVILLDGKAYTLRITQAGKLILTKSPGPHGPIRRTGLRRITHGQGRRRETRTHPGRPAGRAPGRHPGAWRRPDDGAGHPCRPRRGGHLDSPAAVRTLPPAVVALIAAPSDEALAAARAAALRPATDARLNRQRRLTFGCRIVRGCRPLMVRWSTVARANGAAASPQSLGAPGLSCLQGLGNASTFS